MEEYQRHMRVRESHGRKKAESLNEMVLWWSLAVTASIMVVAVAQVLILKKLFDDLNVDGIHSRASRAKLRALILGTHRP